MPQWEHRKIDLNNVPRKSDDIDLLNDAGDQGWELVTITTNSIAYFKRQLEVPTRRHQQHVANLQPHARRPRDLSRGVRRWTR